MNKYRNILSLALSVTAIAISIIALCRVYPNTSDLEMDYQGIIVGILALLVTVLIGWNIYTLMDFNSARKYVDDMKMGIDKQEMDIYTFRKESDRVSLGCLIYAHIKG